LHLLGHKAPKARHALDVDVAEGWSRSIIMVCAMVTPCTTEGVTMVFAPRTSLYTTMGVEPTARSAR
jgi:hypothetical protein